MIFKIVKNLYIEKEDFAVRNEENILLFRVTTMKKGLWLYGENGEQVGQIMFENNFASIGTPFGSALYLERRGENNFVLSSPKLSAKDKEGLNTSVERENRSVYQIYGDTAGFCYDIFEKKEGERLPSVRAKVINDIRDEGYYKVRTYEGANVLKLLMVTLAIAKLNADPTARY